MRDFLKLVIVAAVIVVGGIVLLLSLHSAPVRASHTAGAQKQMATPAQKAKAAKCAHLLDSRGPARLWHNSQYGNDRATVEVNDAFFGSDYDEKIILSKVFQCVATDGRMDVPFTVIYIDRRDHREVASWDAQLNMLSTN